MEGLDAKHLNFEWDPVARLASELGDQKFVDLDYPPLETPGTYATTEVKKPHKLVYKRASSIYGNPEVFSGGIAPDDIKQGELPRGNQIFNPTSMCAYATVSTQGFRPCFENSTRAIDSSKDQPNRLRCDRAREFCSLVRTTQTSG